jgi:beta-fructofuranosidase
MLERADLWIWDSWAVTDGDTHHLFFLQAPRSLGDPERRHGHAAVGHATSTDLRTWTYHGECLGPSAGGFDDRAIWTGSVTRARGRWWMFYAALSTEGPWLEQRIGTAVSRDLFTWERIGAPLGPDPRWYAGPTWRDPFVQPDPAGGWRMLVTAAARTGGPTPGVIGCATSPDLESWTVREPLSTPAGFAHLEVPQHVVVEGRPVLVFSCLPSESSRGAQACLWSAPGDPPWDIAAARPFTADPWRFAAPLVETEGWALLGFHNPPTGAVYAIHDPLPVTLDPAGYLTAR